VKWKGIGGEIEGDLGVKERVTLRITILFTTQIGGMSEIVLKNMRTLFSRVVFMVSIHILAKG
jgi:hypothetical protein